MTFRVASGLNRVAKPTTSATGFTSLERRFVTIRVDVVVVRSSEEELR